MGKKYYAPVKPVSVAVVQVFRVDKSTWAVGYRSSFKDTAYLPYPPGSGSATYSSEASAQQALNNSAKMDKLKEVE